jgi:hypothetical protein
MRIGLGGRDQRAPEEVTGAVIRYCFDGDSGARLSTCDPGQAQL